MQFIQIIISYDEIIENLSFNEYIIQHRTIVYKMKLIHFVCKEDVAIIKHTKKKKTDRRTHFWKRNHGNMSTSNILKCNYLFPICILRKIVYKENVFHLPRPVALQQGPGTHPASPRSPVASTFVGSNRGGRGLGPPESPTRTKKSPSCYTFVPRLFPLSNIQKNKEHRKQKKFQYRGHLVSD